MQKNIWLFISGENESKREKKNSEVGNVGKQVRPPMITVCIASFTCVSPRHHCLFRVLTGKGKYFATSALCKKCRKLSSVILLHWQLLRMLLRSTWSEFRSAGWEDHGVCWQLQGYVGRLPVFKSSSVQRWPVPGMIDLPRLQPIAAELFFVSFQWQTGKLQLSSLVSILEKSPGGFSCVPCCGTPWLLIKWSDALGGSLSTKCKLSERRQRLHC